MKNQAPNAAQKRWREQVRELGPIGCEIHHVVGRTARHNKVHIGHWWILPLSKERHQEIHSCFDRKEQERVLWNWMLAAYQDRYGEVPVPHEALYAIMDYHR